MPEPAQLIASNLGALPHPDGTPRQLAGFATRLLPDAMRAHIERSAGEIGESIVYLLETNGWHIVTDAQLAAAASQTEDPPNLAYLHCKLCNTRLLSISLVNPSHVVTNGPELLTALAARSAKCPHDPV